MQVDNSLTFVGTSFRISRTAAALEHEILHVVLTFNSGFLRCPYLALDKGNARALRLPWVEATSPSVPAFIFYGEHVKCHLPAKPHAFGVRYHFVPASSL